jgi:hypothetical protein
MHVKVSMRPIARADLTEHEAKRCGAAAKGRHWEIWEEDILWWSPDREGWRPLLVEVLPRRRRWMMVETEDGYAAALIWEVEEDSLRLPAEEPSRQYAPTPSHTGYQPS